MEKELVCVKLIFMRWFQERNNVVIIDVILVQPEV